MIIDSHVQYHVTVGDIVHILIDFSVILFTIISNYLSLKKGMIWADLIECCVLSVFMIFTSLEDLKVSSSILVLGISDDLAQEIKTAVKRISMLEGVINMKEPKYWIESPGHLVGMISVFATQDADIKYLRSSIQNICDHTFQEVVIQIDQQSSFSWM